MKDMILYFGLALIGYILGKKKGSAEYTAFFQTLSLLALVGTMGLRMGMNEEVISNMKSIGLYALLFTIVVMILSCAFITVFRKVMRINRYGIPTKENASLPTADVGDAAPAIEEESSGTPERTSLCIVLFLLSGLAIGLLYSHLYIILPLQISAKVIDFVTSSILTGGLCGLLFFTGVDMGAEGNILSNFQKAGFKVFLTPLAVIAGTMTGSILLSFILPVSPKECLAIGAGFGWYSLAPGILMSSGYTTAGAISLLHNVMRETISMISIPVVAKKVGYMECVGLSGANAMDVCLPLVQKSAGSRTAVYSFFSGGTLTILVPILVTAMVSL